MKKEHTKMFNSINYKYGFLAIVMLFSSAFAKSDSFDIKTLSVMNFDNRNASGQWQWLSKGLADMIITDLSASERLMIVGRERLDEIVSGL